MSSLRIAWYLGVRSTEAGDKPLHRGIGSEDVVLYRASVLFDLSGSAHRFAGSPFANNGFMSEDREIGERMQRDMRSPAGAPGRFVELMRVLADFHRYLSDRLSAPCAQTAT
jgi:hypothetical protein